MCTDGHVVMLCRGHMIMVMDVYRGHVLNVMNCVQGHVIIVMDGQACPNVLHLMI